MRRERLSKWLEALRSKEYIQTDSALRKHDNEKNKDSYCCLGVLADQCQRLPGFQWRVPSFVTLAPDYYADLEYEMAVGPEVHGGDITGTFTDEQLKALGLHEEWQNALVRLNDAAYTFGTIAKVVEKYGHALHRPLPMELTAGIDPWTQQKCELSADRFLKAAKIRGYKRKAS